MISSHREKFCQLKALLEPIAPRQIIRGIKPMASFVVNDNLYISDQISNSIQQYTLKEKAELVKSENFSEEGANWFANYDSNTEHIWMIGKNTKKLLLLNRDLHLEDEIKTPANTGFFFTHQGKHFLLSGFSAGNKLYRLEGTHFVACNNLLPVGIGCDCLMGRNVGTQTLFHYYNSKIILRFTGERFVRIAQLHHLPGIFYDINFIERLNAYAVLSMSGKRSVLCLYSKNFEFIHSYLLDQATCSGSFGIRNLDVYVASRQRGFIHKYVLDPQHIGVFNE